MSDEKQNKKVFNKDTKALLGELYTPMISKEEAEEWAIENGFDSLSDFYAKSQDLFKVNRKEISPFKLPSPPKDL